MEKKHTGVLIARVDYKASAQGVLLPGDVMLSIDGIKIANDGTVQLYGRRLALISTVQRLFVGDKVAVRILRDGKEMEVEVTLAGPSLLVPRGQYDTRPTFTLVGGMLFQNLSLEFLQSWGDLKDAPVHLVEEYYSSPVREDRQEVVVLTQVLQDQVNVGYFWESIGLEVVRKVNDVDVVNLAHFVQLVDAAMTSGEGEYLTLNLGKNRVPQRVILEKAALPAADERIRERYGIPKGRSDNFPPAPWL